MKLSTRPYKEEVEKVLNLLIAGHPLVMYDVETTGLKSLASKILSCSAIKYQYKEGMFLEIGRMDCFINPGMPIPEEASRVNGITNEMVADRPDEWTAFEEEIYPFFGDEPVLGGYNIANFDNKFMEYLWLRSSGLEFKPAAVIDVLRMVQEKMHLKSATLENAAKELGADIGIKFHSSLDDVQVTQRVMELLIPLYYDATEPAKFRYKIYGCHYQYYSHKNERIYVHTYPVSKTYYDVYRKDWVSEGLEDFDLNDVQTDVFKFMGVSTIKEFVDAVKSQKADVVDEIAEQIATSEEFNGATSRSCLKGKK